MEQGEGREVGAVAAKRRLTTDVSEASHQWLSRLKVEWGLRSRGAVIDRLLTSVFQQSDDSPAEAAAAASPVADPAGEPWRQGDGISLADRVQTEQDPASTKKTPAASVDEAASSESTVVSGADDGSPALDASERSSGGPDRSARLEGRPITGVASENVAGLEEEQDPESLFSETGALVLVNREGSLEASLEFEHEAVPRPHRQSRAAGIDLPGFVRRNTAQLRRSLNPPPRVRSSHADVLPALADADLVKALETAADHWFSLYGQPANEAVLEASMAWLAHDIWTQSDQSEGEAFTWTLAQHLIAPCVPSWQEGPPTLERVIVLAGLLEDPFSASTLSLRIPTLIRRFVHRFRRRRQGASFQTLEHTMTLHGALKLLQIPIDSGQRLTLPLIREAYREMAMNHHPDAGGSVEMMRRLNEAYQLLKELYRNKEG
jgi:hypothetical protein